MGRLSQAVVLQAVIEVNGMDLARKVATADEIFLVQPNLLSSVLALPIMGASMEQVEVMLHILLVAHEAMKLSGHTWPVVTEADQEKSLQRLTARMRFREGLPSDLAYQVIQQYLDEHRERYLLAFVYGHLGEHDALGVRTDAQKYMLLAAFNLVECIAEVGAKTPA